MFAGLTLSIIATLIYIYPSVNGIIFSRIIHGIGFGLSTTFAAAIAIDIIPAARRGEGIGYFGLGSTIAMAVAPAIGLIILAEINSTTLFLLSATISLLAIFSVKFCKTKEIFSKNVAKKSLKNKLFERGTGLPSILTILFGAAYGGVNTFIAMMANEAQISHVGLFFAVGRFLFSKPMV